MKIIELSKMSTSRPEMQATEETTSISNRARLEVLEEHTNKITLILEGVTNNITKLRVAIKSNTEEN